MNSTNIRVATCCGLALITLILTACANGPRSSPYAPLAEPKRDSAKAQRLTQKAAAIMNDYPDEAERLLCEALSADICAGNAHNNLGVLRLRRGDWYSAASEFEWARKLMPGHPDPRMNLALTLEKAGRTDEALATYETALEVYPGHMPTIEAIARLRVRRGDRDQQVVNMLRQIALEGESQQWRSWAQEGVALSGPATKATSWTATGQN